MFKKVFIRYFYQIISSLGVVVVLEIPIIVGFFIAYNPMKTMVGFY